LGLVSRRRNNSEIYINIVSRQVNPKAKDNNTNKREMTLSPAFVSEYCRLSMNAGIEKQYCH